MNLWEEILQRVESKVNRHSFNTWFRPTRLLFEAGNTVGVLVPNAQFRDWLNKHYAGIIHESLDELHRPDLEVVFETDAPRDGASSTSGSTSGSNGGTAKPVSDPAPVGYWHTQTDEGYRRPAPELHTPPKLNPKYRFDTFVVGTSNQFAHAAARAVAEAPSRAYNPLFIYGGVGLGKTHLLHAIGHHILEHAPSSKLVYISAEKFMNDLINAIRYDRILDFRDKHRSFDVLLVDDIQFIAGKERTQEEFFHTFNALYGSNKQIVVTSDRPPKEIPTLEERLISRFEWGLISDIQAPDYETRLAILRKKVERQQVHIPDDVLCFIADNVKSNIRELEGSLVKLLVHASVYRKDITDEVAREVLKDFMKRAPKKVNIALIQKLTSQHFRVPVEAMKSKIRTAAYAYPRQVAIYLTREITNYSLTQIGQHFGGRDHTTVIHACQKINEKCENDVALKATIEQLKKELV